MKRAGHHLAVGWVVFLVGCGPGLMLKTDPNAYDFPSGEVGVLPSGTAVTVRNGYTGPQSVQLLSSVHCDLQDLSQTAAAIVARELNKAGLPTPLDATRTITLRVVDPHYDQGWRQHVALKLEAALGSGE